MLVPYLQQNYHEITHVSQEIEIRASCDKGILFYDDKESYFNAKACDKETLLYSISINEISCRSPSPAELEIRNPVPARPRLE